MTAAEPLPEEVTTGLSRRSFARVLATGAAIATIRPAFAAATTPVGTVRLSANENPYGPSAAALKAMTDALSKASRYPDQIEADCVSALAALHGVSSSEILLGCGSSDILRVAVDAFTGAGRPLVTANPTFEAPGKAAHASGADVVLIPLDSAFAHDVPKMLEAGAKGGMLYVCNPNNPTATITPKALLQMLIEKLPTTTYVLVDEAYHHYATSADYESAVPLVKSHPNLIVARTFSKVYAMAGIRLGYAVAQKETIQKLEAKQQWDPVSVVALAGAMASIADKQHVITSRDTNSATKRWVAEQLSALGYTQLPSEANFVMIDLRKPVRPVITALRERGVHVGRPFSAMPNHLRVTIGTRDEMAKFVTALARV